LRLKKRLVITSRDIAIFKMLFEQRVASHAQIAKYFFSGTNRRGVYSRLSKLAESQFISKNAVRSSGRLLLVYGLEPSGFKIVCEDYKRKVSQPLFKSDSILHDVTLVDIRERFHKLGMVLEYVPENVLQACGEFHESEAFRPFVHLNSDGAMRIKTSTGEHHVALEYEASIKNGSRYAKKLSDYYLAREIAGVFYICGNTGIERMIRRIDCEVGEKFEPKIHTCLLGNFQNLDLPLAFSNRKSTGFVWT
jgi:hypothetical protein